MSVDSKAQELMASSECPICGQDTPHGHYPNEIQYWINAQSSRFGYVARIFAYKEHADAFESHALELMEEAARQEQRAYGYVFEETSAGIDALKMQAGKIKTFADAISAKDAEIARLRDVVEAACEWHRREYNGASAQRVNEAQLEFVSALSALQEGEK